MTDHQLYVSGSALARGLPGRNPVAPQATVTINGFVDRRRLLFWRKLGNNRTVYGDWPSTDSNSAILRYEPCYQVRDNGPKMTQYTGPEQTNRVLSSLNGAFQKTAPLWAIQDSVHFMGLASNVKLTDGDNLDSDSSIAIIQGGSQTTVNTGDAPIHAGDSVMWSLPNLDAPQPAGGNGLRDRDNSKLLLKLHTYHPEAHAVTADNAYDAIQHVQNSASRGVALQKVMQFSSVMQGAGVLERAILEIMALGVHVAALAGICQASVNGLPVGDQAYARDRDLQDRFHGEARRAFGLRNVRTDRPFDKTLGTLRTNEPKLTVPGTGSSVPVRHYAIGAAFGKYMVAETKNVDNGNGEHRERVNAQKSIIADLLAGTARAQHSATRRIIGVATSEALPGGDFDIILGSYQA